MDVSFSAKWSTVLSCVTEPKNPENDNLSLDSNLFNPPSRNPATHFNRPDVSARLIFAPLGFIHGCKKLRKCLLPFDPRKPERKHLPSSFSLRHDRLREFNRRSKREPMP